MFLLDSLHSHITSGNPISTFPCERLVEQFNSRSVEPAVEPIVEQVVECDVKPFTEQYTKYSVEPVTNFSNPVFFQELSSCLKSLFLSVNNNSLPVSPLEKYRILQECSDKKWLLTTADLEKILEKNPKKSRAKITFLCLAGGLLLPRKCPIKTFGKLSPFPPNLSFKT